jgi:hypothetical protein
MKHGSRCWHGALIINDDPQHGASPIPPVTAKVTIGEHHNTFGRDVVCFHKRWNTFYISATTTLGLCVGLYSFQLVAFVDFVLTDFSVPNRLCEVLLDVLPPLLILFRLT